MSNQNHVLTPAWSDAIAQFATWLAAGGRSSGTVQLRSWWISKLAHDCAPAGPWDLSADAILRWSAEHDWSPNTRRSARAAVRRFFFWARAAGHRTDDPSELLLSVQIPRPAPRPAPLEILTQALRTSTSDHDRLMLLLASFTGLRRTEISRVHADDITEGFLFVHGKGGVQRFVPIHELVRPLMQAVQERGGWAFPGRFTGHCHPDYIGRRLSKLLGPGWTGHTLRHRFATEAYRASRDLLAVQQLLGHASVATTQIYVGVDRAALTAAVNAIPSPAN